MVPLKFITLLLSWTFCRGPVTYNVKIGTDRPVHLVNDHYLSVAIDSGVIRAGLDLHCLNDPKLLTLTEALSPAFLRLGGTGEDFMTFKPDGASQGPYLTLNELNEIPVNAMPQKPFNMTGKQLDQILDFIGKTNMDFFFGLNVLKRRGGVWDPSNAKLIMDYIAERGTKIHWQLGNEPPFGKFNVTMEGQQLAKDFLTLHEMKLTYPLFEHSLLVGPDIGQLKDKLYKIDFFDHFVRHAVPILDAVTWHMYYLNGRTATINDFIDPDILDELIHETAVVTKLTRNYSPNVSIWLGETSSTYGGGTEGLSDSYVAGFMWLDKLGLSARIGVELVIRQSLFRGHYALLGDDFDPRPDYWLSLLYKRLVGGGVLDVKLNTESRSVRVYAHCAKPPYPKGTMVIYALNLLHDQDVQLDLDGSQHVDIDQFLLTPDDDDLRSKVVLLNGYKLEMPDEKTLPKLEPIQRDRIQLPRLSFGFFVAKNLLVEACLM